jgi:hypothetical protein
LKLENSFMARWGFQNQQVEYHRRHFILKPNQLEYYRMLMQGTAGTKNIFLLSELESVELVETDANAALSFGAADVRAAVKPSPLYSTFEAIGVEFDWPIVTAVSTDSVLSAGKGPDVALHALIAIGETSVMERTLIDAVAILSREMEKCLEQSPPQNLPLTFKPAARRLQFELTMNQHYRKPGRIYRMQATGRASCEAWVEALRKAKDEFQQLGPWQTRGLVSQLTEESVVECRVLRSRQFEPEGMLASPYTVFVVEAMTHGGVPFEVEKRFSDFRALHDEWLAPVESLGSPLPLPMAVLVRPPACIGVPARQGGILRCVSCAQVGKNDEETVNYRKLGLTVYMAEALAMTQRLGSPAVVGALQRFLRLDGSAAAAVSGGGDGFSRSDEMVPKSELWQQVHGAVWDVVGEWVVTTKQGLLRQTLVLAKDGNATYSAEDTNGAKRGAPSVTRTTGKWSSKEHGQQVEVSLAPFDPGNEGVQLLFSKHEVGTKLFYAAANRSALRFTSARPCVAFSQVPHDDETIRGVAWGSNALQQRRLLKSLANNSTDGESFCC